MNKTLGGILAISVLALVLGFYAVSKPAVVIETPDREPVGGVAGNDADFFRAGALITGGNGVETLLPASTTVTLTSAQVCSGKTIVWAPGVTNSTATLPSAVSLVRDCLRGTERTLELNFRNASGAGQYNVVAGTGMTLFHSAQAANSTTTITSSTPATWRLRVTLVSSTDSTIQAFLFRFLTP